MLPVDRSIITLQNTYVATLRAVTGRDMAFGAVVKAEAELRAIKARKSFMVDQDE